MSVLVLRDADNLVRQRHRDRPHGWARMVQDDRMRKNLAIVILATFAAMGAAAITSAPAHARPNLPVEVKKDSCGHTNVYVNGQPLFDYTQVWCGPDTY